MAVVAQLVEHLIVVQDVAGSSPVDRPSLDCFHLLFHLILKLRRFFLFSWTKFCYSLLYGK